MANEGTPKPDALTFIPSIPYSETDPNDPQRIWDAEDTRVAQLPEYAILFYRAHGDIQLRLDTPVDTAIVDVIERHIYRVLTRHSHPDEPDLSPLERALATEFLNVDTTASREDLMRVYYDRADFMERVLYALQNHTSLAEATEELHSGRAEQISKAIWRKLTSNKLYNLPGHDDTTSARDTY